MAQESHLENFEDKPLSHKQALKKQDMTRILKSQEHYNGEKVYILEKSSIDVYVEFDHREYNFLNKLNKQIIELNSSIKEYLCFNHRDTNICLFFDKR